jgi:hypothetical protein
VWPLRVEGTAEQKVQEVFGVQGCVLLFQKLPEAQLVQSQNTMQIPSAIEEGGERNSEHVTIRTYLIK